MEDLKVALQMHPQRVTDYPISWEAVRQGVRTPPPLPQFVVSAPLEDGSWTADSDKAQRKFYQDSPWLLDSKLFESILFEPPDNPNGSLVQALLDTVASTRSLAKLAERHADEAELIAQKLQDKEGIIASLHDDFVRP